MKNAFLSASAVFFIGISGFGFDWSSKPGNADKFIYHGKLFAGEGIRGNSFGYPVSVDGTLEGESI